VKRIRSETGDEKKKKEEEKREGTELVWRAPACVGGAVD
jgi:hypothetical protein